MRRALQITVVSKNFSKVLGIYFNLLFVVVFRVGSDILIIIRSGAKFYHFYVVFK